MNIKDKRDGMSREGSGRVGIYRATGLTNCYTIECSFHGAKKLAHLYPNYNKKNRTIIPEYNSSHLPNYMYEGKVKNYYIYTA